MTVRAVGGVSGEWIWVVFGVVVWSMLRSPLLGAVLGDMAAFDGIRASGVGTGVDAIVPLCYLAAVAGNPF